MPHNGTAADSDARQASQTSTDYRALFEAAGEAIIVFDPQSMRILDANPAAVTLYAYPLDELLRMTLPDISAEPHKTVQAVAENRTHVAGRYHRRSDGALLLVDISVSPLTLGGCETRVGFIRDVTERARTQAALDVSESKFATAFKTSPDAININRLSDGLFIDINDGFTQLTGYTEADVIGRTSSDIDIWVDPEDRLRLIVALQECGEATNLEARFRRKDGDIGIGLMSARIMEAAGESAILSVTRDISERKHGEEALLESNLALQAMAQGVTEAMGRVVEVRDPYTRGHQLRVREIADLIGCEMGLSDDDRAALTVAASVHDIGKLGVPVEILTRPKPLNDIELDIVRTHPQQGYEILKEITFPWPIGEIVLQHHERADGSGYPLGLTAHDTHPLARVLAVADVVEAMASHRPYRAALGLEAAIDELKNNGHRYDERVSQACIRLYERGELPL